jgi:RNA polymerase sigma factor (sigma-70 family)
MDCSDQSDQQHQKKDLQARYTKLIAALNADMGWGLSASQQRAYLAGLLQHPPRTDEEEHLQRQIENYHKDHHLVWSLRDRSHPQHDDAWTKWVVQTMRILQHRGLGTACDFAVSLDDLAQVALDALIGALPSYRYESRFSTWAHTVITRSVLRYLKSARVRKASATTSLDQQPDGGDFLLGQRHDSTSIEVLVEEHTLRDVLYRALHEHPDKRMVNIFQLRAQGQRLADIGKQFQPAISASRVCVLLDQGCQFLREHPEVQQWIDAQSFHSVKSSQA